MLKYWLWLSTRKGLSNSAALAVLQHFASPEEAYFSDISVYRQIEALNNPSALLDKDLSQPEQILNDCYQKGIHILTYQDAAYPKCLKHIDNAPIVLYYQGVLPAVDTQPAIAVVGTRKASGYGLTQAKSFGYQLGRSGAVVISGGAAGIDTMALKGALTAGNPVIAVLGNGVDVVYPTFNRDLFEDIRAHGCLISEYPPGTKPLSEHFPMRNRILSGLSHGVLVVEAPLRSGALITASRALEQGRDVFVLPANVGNKAAEGNLRLLKEGAIVATDAWDILQEYVHIYPLLSQYQPQPLQMSLSSSERRLAQSRKSSTETPGSEDKIEKQELSDKKVIDKPEKGAYIDVHEFLDSLSQDEKAIVLLLTEGPLHIDDMIDRSQLPASRVLASITMLEVKGYLNRLPARRFSLAENS